MFSHSKYISEPQELFLHLPDTFSVSQRKDSYNCSSLKSHLSLHAAQLNVLGWVPCLTESEQRAGWKKSPAKNTLHFQPDTVHMCGYNSSRKEDPPGLQPPRPTASLSWWYSSSRESASLLLPAGCAWWFDGTKFPVAASSVCFKAIRRSLVPE